MCGFYVAVSNAKLNTRKHQVGLTGVMHRGPDFQDYLNTPDGFFGHARLSILDPTPSSNQPFVFKNYILVYNGEIYNFKALRSELEDYGVQFETYSDTEVLLQSFIYWGPSFICRLNGMYSFVIFNSKTKELHYGRDRFGIKPLYSHSLTDGIILASEPRSISRIINSRFNQNILGEYFRDRFHHGIKTFFKEIFEVRPGIVYLFNVKKSSIEIIYQFRKVFEQPEKLHQVPRRYFNSKVHDLLERAVVKNLISDVEVGCFMSGGLDSSLVSYFASKNTTDLKTFSVSFESKKFNEAPFQRIMAERLETDHHDFKSTHENFFDGFCSISKVSNTPILIPNYVQIYQLSDMARTKVKVLLTGEGADEIFGGYSRYQICQRKHFVKLAKLNSIFKFFGFFDQRFKKYISLGTLKADFLRIRNFTNSQTLQDILDLSAKPDDKKLNTINDLLIYDQESYLKGLLQRADFMTMLAGVEARVPFLDEDLVNYVQTTHSANKVNLFARKRVLYDVARKIIPKEILVRPKIGFASPLVDWFSEAEGMGLLLNNLSSKSEPIYRYLPFDKVSSYLSQPVKEQDVEGLTFPIVSLNEWLKGIEN